MTQLEQSLLSQTKDKEKLAGLLFMEIYENDNKEVWDMLKEHQSKINKEMPDKITREIFETIAQELIDKG